MTTRVLEQAPPESWKLHRFGLSPDRWAELSNRGFWITGAGTGYGRALAVALACAGANVFLTGRRESKLIETAEEARGLGAPGVCEVLPADVTSEEQVYRAAQRIAARNWPLLGVVAAAGVPQAGPCAWPLLEESLPSWNRILSVNLLGAWLPVRSGIPLMVSTGKVRCLLLSSGAGWANTPGFGQYNVSKAALNSLGMSLAAECAKRYPEVDVQINTINPGEARTEMNQGSMASPYALASMALLLLSHPTGGPNGRFFHRDGRHLEFAESPAYPSGLSA